MNPYRVKVKINLENKSQKQIPKSSRDLSETKNPKMNTNKISKSRRLREKWTKKPSKDPDY